MPDELPARASRLVVHDYAGHPFQIQLSRELVHRGFVVDHQYCPSYVSGHGDMDRRPHDLDGLTITPIPLRRPFAGYRPFVRVRQEVEYALKAFRAAMRMRPDLVLICNMPLIADLLLTTLLRSRGLRYVFWHQDIHTEAIRDALARRLPAVVARPASALAERMERRVAFHAGHVVAIADEFVEKYRAWGLPPDSYSVIPNWAEPGQFADPVGDRAWLAHDRVRTHLLVYSGTLGLKHDPGMLLALARAPELDDCTVAVVSQGRGREWLAERLSTVDDGRLVLRDYVPIQELAAILASADVLISVLEPAASRFSVPSKVLTYLCAGRPVLAVMDPANAAARLIRESGAGVVLPHPEASQGPAVLRELLDDPGRREKMGAAGRALAERRFDIVSIADRFEAVIRRASRPARPVSASAFTPRRADRTRR